MRSIALNTARLQGKDFATETVPAFQFTVVRCHDRFNIVKIFKSNWEQVIPDVRPAKFLFYPRRVELIEDFAKGLNELATQPKMGIIPGQLLPEFTGYQRRTLDPFNKYGNPVTITCPPLSYLIIDIDGMRVPHGLGDPDKVAEVGYHIRDRELPPCFRGIRGVVTATAQTGIEPDIARVRFWFLTSEAYDVDIVLGWLGTLKFKRPALCVDPSVMDPNHITYTGRPIFDGWNDPVPDWGRVRILDGYEDFVTLDMSNVQPMFTFRVSVRSRWTSSKPTSPSCRS
jgi:hypothetical protein